MKKRYAVVRINNVGPPSRSHNGREFEFVEEHPGASPSSDSRPKIEELARKFASRFPSVEFAVVEVVSAFISAMSEAEEIEVWAGAQSEK